MIAVTVGEGKSATVYMLAAWGRYVAKIYHIARLSTFEIKVNQIQTHSTKQYVRRSTCSTHATATYGHELLLLLMLPCRLVVIPLAGGRQDSGYSGF